MAPRGGKIKARAAQETVVFLVDVSPSMHAALPLVADTLGNFAVSKMLTDPGCEVGLVLFGSSGTRNGPASELGSGYRHVVEVFAPRPPDRAMLRALSELPLQKGPNPADALDAAVVGISLLDSVSDEAGETAGSAPVAELRRFVLLSTLTGEPQPDPGGEVTGQVQELLAARGIELHAVVLGGLERRDAADRGGFSTARDSGAVSTRGAPDGAVADAEIVAIVETADTASSDGVQGALAAQASMTETIVIDDDDDPAEEEDDAADGTSEAGEEDDTAGRPSGADVGATVAISGPARARAAALSTFFSRPCGAHLELVRALTSAPSSVCALASDPQALALLAEPRRVSPSAVFSGLLEIGSGFRLRVKVVKKAAREGLLQSETWVGVEGGDEGESAEPDALEAATETDRAEGQEAPTGAGSAGRPDGEPDRPLVAFRKVKRVVEYGFADPRRGDGAGAPDNVDVAFPPPSRPPVPVKAVRYGPSGVLPLTPSLAESMRYAPSRSLRLVNAVPTPPVPAVWSAGESWVVVADKGHAPSRAAMEALVAAFARRRLSGVFRFVPRAGGPVRLCLGVPVLEPRERSRLVERRGAERRGARRRRGRETHREISEPDAELAGPSASLPMESACHAPPPAAASQLAQVPAPLTARPPPAVVSHLVLMPLPFAAELCPPKLPSLAGEPRERPDPLLCPNIRETVAAMQRRNAEEVGGASTADGRALAHDRGDGGHDASSAPTTQPRLASNSPSPGAASGAVIDDGLPNPARPPKAAVAAAIALIDAAMLGDDDDDDDDDTDERDDDEFAGQDLYGEASDGSWDDEWQQAQATNRSAAATAAAGATAAAAAAPAGVDERHRSAPEAEATSSALPRTLPLLVPGRTPDPSQRALFAALRDALAVSETSAPSIAPPPGAADVIFAHQASAKTVAAGAAKAQVPWRVRSRAEEALERFAETVRGTWTDPAA